jgi:sulfotransferase famil protein
MRYKTSRVQTLKDYATRQRLSLGYLKNRLRMRAAPTWLDKSHWSRLLCFVHIPKCAGTSFNDALWDVYGRSFLGYTYHAGSPPCDPGDITRDQAKDVLAISGHFPYGFHRKFGPQDEDVFADREVHYVSIVRDPVNRLLSVARHVRSFPSHKLHKATKNMTYAEFFEYVVASGNTGIIGNAQSRLLTDRHPERAAEYARTRYLAVATVESAPDMISAVSEKLCWPEISLGHKNRSPKSPAKHEDLELAKRICAEYCQHDMALYDYVRSQPGGFLVNAD